MVSAGVCTKNNVPLRLGNMISRPGHLIYNGIEWHISPYQKACCSCDLDAAVGYTANSIILSYYRTMAYDFRSCRLVQCVNPLVQTSNSRKAKNKRLTLCYLPLPFPSARFPFSHLNEGHIGGRSPFKLCWVFAWSIKVNNPASPLYRTWSYLTKVAWWHSPYPMSASRKGSSETACNIPMSVPLFSRTTHDRPLPPPLTSTYQGENHKISKQKQKKKEKKRKERKTSSPHAITSCACRVRRQEKAWEKWCTDLRYEKQEGWSVKLRPWALWIYSGVFPFLPSSQWVWWDNKYLCGRAKIIVVWSLVKVFNECVSFWNTIDPGNTF